MRTPLPANRRLVPWCLLVLWLGAFGTRPAPAQNLALITAEGEAAILADPGTDAAGAQDADLTLVEYFDYNCPYCKKIAPELERLLAQDGKIRLVYKEWPILGEVSVYAAKAALAARWQGKYLAAHDALMKGPKLTSQSAVDAALQRAGVDLPRLRLDLKHHASAIDSLLARNEAEAHALSIRGTPGILIGRLLLPGVTDLNGLKAIAAQARAQSARPGSS